MAGTRTYSHALIVGLFILCFLAGLGIGTWVTQRMYYRTLLKELASLKQAQGANTLIGRRMRAIEQAIKEGKIEYEFETGYLPPLGGKK